MTGSEIHAIAQHVIAQIPRASLRRAPLLTDGVWTIEVCHPSVQFFWLRVPIRDRELATADDRARVEMELWTAVRHLAGRADVTLRYATH